jgi:2-polyprenyl-3-methyl-5-hydroxy-6-metoxy-1,4-benzoquinol methylase
MVTLTAEPLPTRDRAVGLDLIRFRKPTYGTQARTFQVELLPKPLGRVLDVGCSEGRLAELLRSRGATHVAGIELDEEFSAAARERYDEVVQGSVPEDLSWEPGSFDTILCYDILEHIYDPWSALARLERLLAPGGQLHISIPNARHKDVWLPLVRGGTFNYAPAGLLDVTHMRFFTRSDAERMMEAAGLRHLSTTCVPPTSRKRRLASALTRGRAVEFFAVQWFVLGESRREPSGAGGA